MEELLVKYFTEDINKQEKKLLFEAMDNDDALRKEFYDLQNTMAMAEFVDSNDRTLNRQAYAHFLRIIFRRRLFHQVLKCLKISTRKSTNHYPVLIIFYPCEPKPFFYLPKSSQNDTWTRG